ncbi:MULTISPECIES: hypothetical protein [Amycolatopsis]|uniref:Secreted protein n=1 Tax=Amycolatopsis thermalba TaxID=944492 RepID=A0ABY4NVM3_9PSEU|nr:MULTISPECIES: hypothetical protein [Amycolatopsis]OXM71840.1 hypothetical protein CF166_18075 [Amycolatopsis sp. KNN50.9b]UQS24088.1 hypothetical protein L1857_15270 [Amycolatopsis thermalba]
MSTSVVILIVVVALVVIAGAALLVRAGMRRKRLRERFGPEYDRAVEGGKSKRAAERDLAEREKRHSELDIRPLPDTARQRYRQEWSLVQQQFVDRPGAAILEADRLLTSLMGERGYPTEGYEQQHRDLSVEHANTLEHYRRAHEITEGHQKTEASTEDLRKAMVHYRQVFEDLLGDADVRPEQEGGRHHAR